MSNVHPYLSISRCFAWFEQVARESVDIQHAPEQGRHRFSREVSLTTPANLRSSLSGPALFVDIPDARGVDNKSNNLMMRRIIGFTVSMPLAKNASEDEKVQAIERCEGIALQVLGRMRHERINSLPAARVFADVMIDDFEGFPVEHEQNGQWFGFRIEVPVLNKEERLTYNPARWATAP